MTIYPTSSQESLSGSESTSSSTSSSKPTRKRFSGYQLMMLEDLHARNTHPSREQRETLASQGDMDLKSVTIWFQNKRQAERRTILRNTTNDNHIPTTDGPTNNAPSCHPSTSSRSRMESLSRTTTHARPTLHEVASRASFGRPSLDQVASMSERPAPIPTTPKSNAAPWENMPSSPAAQPESPILSRKRPMLKRTPTLEWACEAARKRGKSVCDGFDGNEDGMMSIVSRPLVPSRARRPDDEATTPLAASTRRPGLSRSRTVDDFRRQPSHRLVDLKAAPRFTKSDNASKLSHTVSGPVQISKPQTVDDPKTYALASMSSPPAPASRSTMSKSERDDEMLQAAWALCGLGSSAKSQSLADARRVQERIGRHAIAC